MTNHKIIESEEPSWPKEVYKYRDWNVRFHSGILTQKEVFFSPPSGFEDPLDCKNHIRYDLLTDEDIFQKYLHYSHLDETHAGWSRQQHRKYARANAKRSPMKDKGMRLKFQQDSFNELDARLGILSLAERPNNIRMWEAYSNNHTGFCVGFNPRIMFPFLGGGGPVFYCDELPTIYPTPKDSMEEQHGKQVFSKLRKWEFEEEYRTHKFNEKGFAKDENGRDERVIVLPAEAYTEVILGALATPEVKSQIIEAVRQILPHVTLKQAILDNQGIRIVTL